MVKYKVSAITGEYEDKQGNAKKRYSNIGVVIATRNGGLMLKLESIPVGWDGAAFLNEPEERKQDESRGYNAPVDDDIPF